MEEASPSGPSCCSRDRKGKQGEERMSSENEVSILMRVLKLICSGKFELWKCLQVVSLFEATNGNRHFRDE